MPAPDARSRTKISLNPSQVIATSISAKQIPNLVVSDVLFVLTIQATKEWLLDFDVGVFWVVMRVLAFGGLGVLGWEVWTHQVGKRRNIEWSALAMAGVLLFVQQSCLFTALYRLPSQRILLFTYFSRLWVSTFTSSRTAKKMLAVTAAAGLAFLSDTGFLSTNVSRYIPGYAALLLHGLVSTALDHTLSVVAPALGETFAMAASVFAASIVALPFYGFKTVLLHNAPTPILPLMSLAIIPFISYTLLFYTPLTNRSLGHQMHSPGHFALSFPIITVSAALLGFLAFSQKIGWLDLPIVGLLYIGMYPESIDAFAARPRTPTSRLIKLYMKTILSNPESRKIFYFLLLNLCYMLVQMLYGVWTNSLGLISDAIHMAFDCMAIGVGLFASVMATWEPNERFTYGYGRIETLSGFANGIFLILISIFIVFEAIQRILEPPEMNTSQLLLVSSVGLGVNLFGMFAMGGHHHHGGHSHSHGHSHGPSISHASPSPLPATSPNHDSSHSHNHDHDQGHSHSHSHSPLPSPSPSSSHSHVVFPQSGEHDLEHEHDHGHSHSDHSHDHSHSNHSQGHSHSDHSHDHSHSHSHSPPPPLRSPQLNSHARTVSFSPASTSHVRTASFIPAPPPLNGSARSKHQRSLSLAPNPQGQLMSPISPVHSHSHGHGNGHGHKPSPSLQVSTHLGGIGSEGVETPLTPSYNFVHDEHLAKHHDTDHSHSHSEHGHGHAGHSHNMRGVFLHVMADTLGSVGVIVSTLLIQFYGWTGFDPIASLFIAVLIAASVVPLVLDTGKILALDIGDKDVVVQEALAELSHIEGVASYTNPRFWPKDSETLVGSIHIQLTPSAASYDPSGPHSNVRTTYPKIDRIVELVQNVLKERIPGLEELTVQVEEGVRTY